MRRQAKPYRCHVCQKGFRYRTDRFRHQLATRHGVKRLSRLPKADDHDGEWDAHNCYVEPDS